MKIGMSLKAFEKASLAEALETVASIGYQGVELRTVPSQLPLDIPPGRLMEISSLLRRFGLQVSCVAGFGGDYTRKDAAGCRQQHEELRRWLELAAAVGSPLLRHWPGHTPSRDVTPEQWDRALDCTRQALEIARGSGVRLVAETHHGTLLDGIDAIERFLTALDSPELGIIHDGANLYHDAADHGASGIAILGARIATAHAKDVVRLQDKSNPRAFVYRGGYFVHRRIDEGGVDHYSVLRGLQAIGYSGFISVESAAEVGEPAQPMAQHAYGKLRDMIEAIGPSVAPAATAA